MKQFLAKYKDAINTQLQEYLLQKSKENETVTRWGKEVPERLKNFATTGKAIRGCLVCLGYAIGKETVQQEAIKAAGAVELVHSSLLIHDDIIDRDKLRRGKPSVFAQYEVLGRQEKLREAPHFGVSQAICAGDVGYFYAFDILTSLKIKPDISLKVTNLFANEILKVAFGEMEDVYLGFNPKRPTVDEIMAVYRYKTARYTFSMPLMIGALLGELDAKTTHQLEELGELLGIIFQIKDDELGLFADEEKLGKPIGSDIKEEKKTLYYLYLLEKADRKQKAELGEIFGKPKISPSMLKFVQDMIISLGIKDRVDKEVDNLVLESQKIITKLDIKDAYRKMLRELLEYSLARKK